jgi:hypothetical protein
LVYNLPPATRSLSDAGLPPGAEMGLNDAGERTYKPICPGSPGAHRYRFKVYAVDIELPSLVQSSERDIVTSMGNHVIAEGQLGANYTKLGQGASLTPPESQAMPPGSPAMPDESKIPRSVPMPQPPKAPAPPTAPEPDSR